MKKNEGTQSAQFEHVFTVAGDRGSFPFVSYPFKSPGTKMQNQWFSVPDLYLKPQLSDIPEVKGIKGTARGTLCLEQIPCAYSLPYDLAVHSLGKPLHYTNNAMHHSFI